MPFTAGLEGVGKVTEETGRGGEWSDACVEAIDDREADRDFVRRRPSLSEPVYREVERRPRSGLRRGFAADVRTPERDLERDIDRERDADHDRRDRELEIEPFGLEARRGGLL